MSFRNRLTILYPILVILLVTQSMFIGISFSESHPPEFILMDDEEKTEIKTGIYFQKGVIGYISMLEDIRSDLDITELPQDARMDGTVDRLERVILSKKLHLVFLLFMMTLALTALFSILTRAWFGIILYKIFLVLSVIFLFSHFGEMSATILQPAVGFSFFTAYLLLSAAAIYNYRTVNRLGKQEELTFTVLANPSLYNEEEKETEGSSEKPGIKTTAWHFSVIILSGILLGNLIYIPVFTLQKNLSAEFGIILGMLLVVISALYVSKYYHTGYEKKISVRENILSAIAFLEFRFITNLARITVSIIIVVIFVVLLVSLLGLNVSVLQKYSLIEKSTEL